METASFFYSLKASRECTYHLYLTRKIDTIERGVEGRRVLFRGELEGATSNRRHPAKNVSPQLYPIPML